VHALEINHVSKFYGQFMALNDIDFRVEAGEFVGLLGVNGAGKTSLISSISGINNFSGEIKVMGHDVLKQVVKAKRALGVVPQELAFDPFLTVYQTLKFQSGLYGVKNNREWIFEVIERLHLSDKVDSNTRTLSGGMKRRLMVAQALIHKPPVIILDEPTTGVDVEIRQSLWNFIAELHQKGHTILLTTHYLEEVERLCNKIIMIDKGSIIAQDSKDSLMHKCSNLPITLEITTQNGLFVSQLSANQVARTGNTYSLSLQNSNEIVNILQVLNDNHVVVENINLKKPSLEDVFIKLLRR